MQQITVRLPPEVIEELDREADERDEYDSRADVIRDRCASGDEGDELRDEVERLRTEVERLRRERRQLLEQREENQELVKFAQEQRSVVREQRERDREKESANMFRRAWWFVAGRPSPDSETSD